MPPSLEEVTSRPGRAAVPDAWTVANAGVARYREMSGTHLGPAAARRHDAETVLLATRTVQTGIRIATAARTRVQGTCNEIAQCPVPRSVCLASSVPHIDAVVLGVEPRP